MSDVFASCLLVKFCQLVGRTENVMLMPFFFWFAIFCDYESIASTCALDIFLLNMSDVNLTKIFEAVRSILNGSVGVYSIKARVIHSRCILYFILWLIIEHFLEVWSKILIVILVLNRNFVAVWLFCWFNHLAKFKNYFSVIFVVFCIAGWVFV